MKCPHCLENFHAEQTLWAITIGADADGGWLLTRTWCPACHHYVFELENGTPALGAGGTGQRFSAVLKTVRVWPKGTARVPMPSVVPPKIGEDYKEACLVLADSPKASAALSRRCLQNVLRTAAGVKHGNLADEIQQVVNSKALPSATAESLDTVRVIGNFAAHPMKSTSTGEIVDVEPHEAEWNLDVLESLFDFYYVLPARAQAKKDAINKKLVDAGKPPLK
jgi:hypothetical protein